MDDSEVDGDLLKSFEEKLTKRTEEDDQKEVIEYCHAQAVGDESISIPKFMVDLAQFLVRLQKETSAKNIFYIFDVLQKATSFSISKSGEKKTKICKISEKTYDGSELVIMNAFIPENKATNEQAYNPKLPIHHSFAILVKSAFYLYHFKQIMIDTINKNKEVPGSRSESEMFEIAQKCKQYVSYHLLSEKSQ